MTRYLSRVLHIVLISALIIGCSRDLIVEKRRYRPGWHIALKGAPEKIRTDIASTALPVANNSVAAAEERQTTAIQEPNELVVEKLTTGSAPESVAASCDRAMAPDVKDTGSLQEAAAHRPDELASPVKASNPSSKKPDQFPFLPVMLGSALALGAALTIRPARVRRISEWAKDHRKTSWAALTAANLGLGLGAFYAGHQAGLDGYQASQSWFTGSALVFFLSLIFYPFRSGKGLFSSGFIRRKWHDLMLSVSGVLLVFSSATTISQRSEPVSPISGAIVSVLLQDHLSAAGTSGQSSGALSDEPGKMDPDKQRSVNITLTFFCVILFLLLWLLVIALSCSYYCSGQKGIAAFVALSGTFLLVLLLVLLMRRIWGKGNKRNNPSAEPATP
jgi:hypothetical protein